MNLDVAHAFAGAFQEVLGVGEVDAVDELDVDVGGAVGEGGECVGHAAGAAEGDDFPANVDGFG